KVEGKYRVEDILAYHRDSNQFRNLLMAEQPNGDFAKSMLKQYLVGVYNFHLYSLLQKSKDAEIAAFASKSLKEVAYHVRHSGDWLLRLGDGTTESHQKLQDAVEDLWYFVDDMFEVDEVEETLLKSGIAADLTEVKKLWNATITEKFKESKLVIPAVNNFMRMGSRQGNHTEHLGYILAEMQFLPRAYPDARW
ncbi:MAG TPA: phenylacetate-CoA oxygenase subunit PaaC, partial [Bacteroidia bacterium]|nr:phenylacetate-CoA oxygenase subunit PaaC [Bacteroidia bacterium]